MLAVPLTDYYEEVRRYLTCPEEVKDDLIYDVNRKVMDLNADRPDLDYNGILEFLGDPEDLANSLMEQMSDEVIQKYEKKKKRIRTGMIACAVAVVIGLSTFALYTSNRQTDSHITEESFIIVEDENVFPVETTIEVLPSFARNYSTSAIAVSNYKNNGNWIATVSLKAYFTYNHITAGVTGTEYSKSLASGWSYTNHKITTTTVSSSNGGTATLTANLKDFPLNVAVRLSLHCSPDGYITKG